MCEKTPTSSRFARHARRFGGTGHETVVGRCVFSEAEVLDKFVDVGGDVGYLQEAASDVYAARGWIFGFGFCFSTASVLMVGAPDCTFFPAV